MSEPTSIRCPQCSAYPVRVRAGIVARHHDPTVGKTWCAVIKDGSTEQMIDIEKECRLSGARVRFP